MTFEEYQIRSRETAIYPDRGNNFVYPILGLVGEVGEITGKIKKVIRDNNGVISEERKQDLVIEIGDALWYISQLATELDISLENIAEANINKILSRKERGTLRGSGDDR